LNNPALDLEPWADDSQGYSRRFLEILPEEYALNLALVGERCSLRFYAGFHIASVEHTFRLEPRDEPRRSQDATPARIDLSVVCQSGVRKVAPPTGFGHARGERASRGMT
jgi:hypothetical protein